MQEPNIIYEDNHVIVVIKPHNISVQEDESKDLDMLTLIKEYIKKRDEKPGNVFLGLVHRLDRPTGGVMVFAKTSKAASRLSKELKEKDLRKHYLLFVSTTWYSKIASLLPFSNFGAILTVFVFSSFLRYVISWSSAIWGLPLTTQR